MIDTISVLIITHNRKEDLAICLDSVRSQEFPSVETIVVDNHSTDGTATMIREKYSSVKYIGLDENMGIAARNIGARKSSGELIVTLDDDSKLPNKKILSRVSEKFIDNPKLGAAGFRLINSDGSEEKWFRWKKIGSLNDGYRSPTFVACGAAIRPEMFERTGGFWKPYFMHLEEEDFSLRIISSGSEVRYFPSISIIHRKQNPQREDSRFIYYTTRNTFWYLWRNFPFVTAFIQSFLKLFSLGYMAIQKGGFGLYVKGLWDVRTKFNEVFSSRNPIDYEDLPWGNRSLPSVWRHSNDSRN